MPKAAEINLSNEKYPKIDSRARISKAKDEKKNSA